MVSTVVDVDMVVKDLREGARIDPESDTSRHLWFLALERA